jgi:hypothetical protein
LRFQEFIVLGAGLRLAFQVNEIVAALFLQLHVDAFVSGGGNILADEVRFDGQLTMTAIDEDGELNAPRSPKSVNASRAARVVRPL